MTESRFDFTLQVTELLFVLPRWFISPPNRQLDAARQDAINWMKDRGIKPLQESVSESTHTINADRG